MIARPPPDFSLAHSWSFCWSDGARLLGPLGSCHAGVSRILLHNKTRKLPHFCPRHEGLLDLAEHCRQLWTSWDTHLLTRCWTRWSFTTVTAVLCHLPTSCWLITTLPALNVVNPGCQEVAGVTDPTIALWLNHLPTFVGASLPASSFVINQKGNPSLEQQSPSCFCSISSNKGYREVEVEVLNKGDLIFLPLLQLLCRQKGHHHSRANWSEAGKNGDLHAEKLYLLSCCWVIMFSKEGQSWYLTFS